MAELTVSRITDPAVEARGFILYADEDWLVLKIDLKEGVTADAIYEYLNSRHICEGVDDEKIQTLVEQSNNGEPVNQEIIAQGSPPKNGKDGALEFFVDMNPKKVEVSDNDGNVDFRDLNLIKEVHSGDQILKLHRPEPGVEGVTIQGKKINPIEGQKGKLRLGKNVRLDEESSIVYATMDGHVEYIEPLLSVHEEFEVHHDVDYTVGNLKFIGSLLFHGNIPSGYSMEAGKNITVKGIATGCNLTAKNNITVENGIVGDGKSKIICEGVLKAKFANEATIECKGGLEIIFEMVRPNVKTNGFLNIENGAIRGGEVFAFEGMRVKELGSPMGTPTFVAVGVDFNVDERIKKLDAAIEQVNQQVKKYQEAIEPFMKNKLLLVKASEEKKSAVKTILNKIEGLKKKNKDIEQMIKEQEASRYKKNKEVEVNGAILDDVTIQIGNKKKKFDKFGRRKGKILYDKKSFEIVFSKSA